MRRLKRLGAALLLLAGCARMAPPPGGPPDGVIPHLIGSADSMAIIPDFDDWIKFRFDEVISEGSQPNFGFGSGDLEKLIILSPDTLVPRVEWHRDQIWVQPRKGWKPNTVYRIELLPGVRDLRNNATKKSMVVTLVTGGPAPSRMVSGRAVDWASRSVIPNALLEVMTLPDSLVYRGAADSTGRFRFGPLRNTNVVVRVVLDRNGDHRVSPGEAWEQVALPVDFDETGELWAFVHDTLPAKVMGELTRRDSLSIAIPVNLPLAPDQELPADSIRVQLLPDSAMSLAPFVAAPQARWDSLYKPKPVAVPDTAPPPVVAPPVVAPPRILTAADSAMLPDLPTANKPAIGQTLVVGIRIPLAWESRYLVEVRGVRTLDGHVGTLRGELRVGKAPTPPKADSTRRADSTRTRDSLPRSPRPR